IRIAVVPSGLHTHGGLVELTHDATFQDRLHATDGESVAGRSSDSADASDEGRAVRSQIVLPHHAIAAGESADIENELAFPFEFGRERDESVVDAELIGWVEIPVSIGDRPRGDDDRGRDGARSVAEVE